MEWQIDLSPNQLIFLILNFVIHYFSLFHTLFPEVIQHNNVTMTPKLAIGFCLSIIMIIVLAFCLINNTILFKTKVV